MPSETDKVMRELERAIEKTVSGISRTVLHELSTTTPIDTGYAGSNWIASTGRTPRVPVGLKSNVDYTAQAESDARLVGYKLKEGRVTIGNATPYIGLLDHGSSPQQAPGFVERAVQKAVRTKINLD